MSNRSPTIERADSIWLPIFQSGSFQPCSRPLGLPIHPTGTASDTSARAALAQSMSFCTVGAPLSPIAPTISPSTLMGNPPPHAAIRASVGMPAKSEGSPLMKSNNSCVETPNKAVYALFCAISMQRIGAPSIRLKALRLPPSSRIATFSLTPSALAFASAASAIFCASSEEILYFLIKLVIGPFLRMDMYCVLIKPAFRESEPAISVPQNQPRRDSHNDFACAGSGNHSAIHVKVRAGYVRRLRTGDKRHQRGDLINVPIAAERCEGFLWYRPLARGRIRIRIDRTRLHVVDCDPPARHFSGQALSEHLDRSLCSRARHEAMRQGALAHGRADGDDAPTAPHVLQRRLRRDEYAADVDVHQAVQFLQRGLLEPLGNGRTSIVHKDVEPAESRHGLFDRGFDGVGISGVRLNCDRLSASAFNLLRDRRCRIGTFRVGDGHVRSVRGQTLGDCSTNAPRAARNECNLSFQVLSHCFSPTPFNLALSVPPHDSRRQPRAPSLAKATAGDATDSCQCTIRVEYLRIVGSPRPRSWTESILRTTLVRVLVRLPNEGGYEHYH